MARSSRRHARNVAGRGDDEQAAGSALCGALIALAVGLTGASSAEEVAGPAHGTDGGPPPAVSSPKREGRAKFFDPDDQQLDLSYFLENPRGFLPVPIVVTEPAIGYGGGAVGLFIRPREEAGAEGWARPNISAAGGFATNNGTWGAVAGDSSRWVDGRLRTLAGGATGRVNLDFYGAGLGRAALDEAVHYSLVFSGGIAQAAWQLTRRSPWALGLRYVYADVEPELHDQVALAGLPDQTPVKVSAPTAIVEYDTRDNVFTPTRGIYAETSYLLSRESLGSSADFERFGQVVVWWLSLPHAVTLGARANYTWSSQSTPFFLKPYIDLRGVPAMRYQGDQATSVEVEGRWQFNGRWSLVAFAGAGATHFERNGSASSQSVGSGGAGFRYELARKFGLHAGLDIAVSPGTTAVYFQVGNAWFRP